MKVLVIGSKGFIGSHVIKAFSLKHDAWGCDVITDYVDVKYFQINITNYNYHKIFANHQFDICINCSGAASVPLSLQEPLTDFELNTVNVFRILDSIKKTNAYCKFINLSSAAVYGNAFQLPIKESAIAQPVSPYGLHKKQSEDICLEFYNYWQIPTCSVRIFSAYGPGLKKQLLWDLYQKSLKGNNIKLFGTGNETRDFIYIDDLVNAIILIAEKGKFRGESINVANGKQWRIRELAEHFFEALNWKGNITFINTNRSGDPLNWEADITLLKEMGYRQQMSMKDGISKYIQWLSAIK